MQAHTLLPLLLREEAEPFASAWIARAERVTVRRLEDEVERALGAGEVDPAKLAPEPQMSALGRGALAEDPALGGVMAACGLVPPGAEPPALDDGVSRPQCSGRWLSSVAMLNR